MNTQVPESIKKMPYEVVFGQPPRSTIVPDVHFKGTFDENDLSIDCNSSNDSQSHIKEKWKTSTDEEKGQQKEVSSSGTRD